MRLVFLLILCVAGLFPQYSDAQTGKVREYLRQVALGKVEEVKKQIPDLLAEYPNDPGVQLLLAVVIDDAALALEKYKNIVKNFPDNEWADDAQWRIVQYYAVIGDTAKAKSELDFYRKKYPTSEFLISATDVVRSSVNYARSEGNKKKTIYSTNQKNLQGSTKDTKIKTADTKTVTAAKVETRTALTENDTTTSVAKTATATSKYGLQVGIYSTQEAAETESKHFKQLRLLTEILKKDVDGDTMWAIVIGDYSSKEAAESAKPFVQQQCKCGPMIFKK
ncbi:MAG: SPOR domain-containing protein [FCB group bacterium]|jgi:hypothetical protein